MFDWRCTSQGCDYRFDSLEYPDKHETSCPKCSSMAVRIISPAHFPVRMGVDPAMPTMAAKWARMHQQGREIDERRAKDNGPAEWGADGADVRR